MLKVTCECGHFEVANTEEEMMGKMKNHWAGNSDCAKQGEGKNEQEVKEMLRQKIEEV